MTHSRSGPDPGRIARVHGGRPIAVAAALALVALVALIGLAPPACAQEPDTTRQRDIVDVARSVLGWNVPDAQLTLESGAGGLSTTLLPTIGYNPLYGFTVGVGLSSAGRIGDDFETRVSRIAAGGSYAFDTGQILLEGRGSFFLDRNTRLVLADIRYLDTTRPTWGLGPAIEGQSEFSMAYKLSRLYLTHLWQVIGPLYAGPGFRIDGFADIVDEDAAPGVITPYMQYTGDSPAAQNATGVSLNVLADSRDNPVNPRSGYLVSLTFNDFVEQLGSDSNWQELQAEYRVYPYLPGGSRNRLAIWGYTWLTYGHPPYLELPYIAGDTYGKTGRGYLLGRIRSTNLAYLEAEYRLELRRDGLLGVVGFGSGTTVTDPGSGAFGSANWAGGLGIRVKFAKVSDTNLAVDFGWGEANSFGVFAGLGEAF